MTLITWTRERKAQPFLSSCLCFKLVRTVPDFIFPRSSTFTFQGAFFFFRCSDRFTEAATMFRNLVSKEHTCNMASHVCCHLEPEPVDRFLFCHIRVNSKSDDKYEDCTSNVCSLRRPYTNVPFFFNCWYYPNHSSKDAQPYPTPTCSIYLLFVHGRWIGI